MSSAVSPSRRTTDGRGLRVGDPSIDGDVLRAPLSLPGRDRDVFYRLGGIEPTHSADALAIALLPLAMRRGWSLELPAELSPRLHDGLASAQALLGDWWQDWNRIDLRTGGHPREAPSSQNRGVACFFTGGVDSFYSVISELDRLDAVIFVHSFDVPLNALEQRSQVSASLREAADALGLELVEVETNLRDLAGPGLKWGLHVHGAALASVALLCGNRFREVLIAASRKSQDLNPWGSHPQLDPLWSTEDVQIVHHGTVPRTRKVAALAGSDTAMGHLRCCFHATAAGQSNCGHCEKCLRTMASLRIVGALERCATLPDRLPLREIERMPVRSRGWATLIRDLIEEAENAGDEDLAKALRKALRKGPRRARLIKARRRAGRARDRSRRRIRRRWRRARRRAAELLGRRRQAPARAAAWEIRPLAIQADRERVLEILEFEGLHRIPSPEMDDFDVGHWLVAERAGTIAGVAGFRVEQTSDGVVGKNLLLAVRKENRGQGIGRALVDHRLQLMVEAGATKVVTNSDRPGLIDWLIRDYGFRPVGELEKLHAFGRPDADRWTTLEAPMHKAAAGMSRGLRAGTSSQEPS